MRASGHQFVHPVERAEERGFAAAARPDDGRDRFARACPSETFSERALLSEPKSTSL